MSANIVTINLFRINISSGLLSLPNATLEWTRIEKTLFYLESVHEFDVNDYYQIDSLIYAINKVVGPKSLCDYADMHNLLIYDIEKTQ